MKDFKPCLFPNEIVKAEDIKGFPKIGSYKLDGIRFIIKDCLGLSRSLKEIPNKQIQERFGELMEYCYENNFILDGEIYSPKLTFQEITHFVMTEDLTSEKTRKKLLNEIKKGEKNKTIEFWTTLPDDLDFYVFDRIDIKNISETYISRMSQLNNRNLLFSTFNNVKIVDTKLLKNSQNILDFYNKAVEEGYEGIMLRDPNSLYKFGRYTIKSGDGYKFKQYETFDAQIINVFQATEVNDGVEKTINELGRSVTSKKKDDRHNIDKAAGFIVNYQDKELKVTLKLNDEEKIKLWKERKKAIGKWIEYKATLVGAKDLPRHPVFLRYREDKD